MFTFLSTMIFYKVQLSSQIITEIIELDTQWRAVRGDWRGARRVGGQTLELKFLSRSKLKKFFGLFS